jgi:riboflavin kinase/FMN adenylyltransferase
MKIIVWEDFIKLGIGRKEGRVPAALSIGVFDGVHIGHKQLIQQILEHSNSAEPTIVTFMENPTKLFHPHVYPGDISSLEQKISIFEDMGILHVILIDFSPEFSKLSGKDFFADLQNHLDLEYISLGKNFHCGMDNDTSAADVRKMLEPNGVQVEIIDQVLYKGMPVSSTRIRELLLSGNIEEVNQMLGRPYTLCVEGCIEGPQSQIVPGQGKYNAIIATNGAGTVNSLIEVKNGSIHFCNEEANAHPVQEIQFLKKVS